MDAIADIFNLAGWTPVKTSDAEFAVRGVEDRIRRKLPSSFRQLLSFTNGIDFLRAHSNSDRPVPRSELGHRTERWDSYNPLHDGLLPFMFENQGVCTWAIGLENGDNPEVFVEVDSGCPPKWELSATAFTEWLVCQVEDTRLLAAAWFAAQARQLDEADLRLLRHSFQEGRRTFAWPGRTNYRFSNARSQLLLWNSQRQCDWWISPVRGVSTNDALDDLRDIAGLVNSLYSIREEHAEELRRWRSKPTGT